MQDESPGPRCPGCDVTGSQHFIQQAIGADSPAPQAGHRPALHTRPRVVFCRCCGHVYGLVDAASAGRPPTSAARPTASRTTPAATGRSGGAEATDPVSAQLPAGADFSHNCSECGDAVTVSARTTAEQDTVRCPSCGAVASIDTSQRRAARQALRRLRQLQENPRLSQSPGESGGMSPGG